MRIKDFEDTLKTHPNVLSFKLAHDLKDRLVYSYTYRVGNIYVMKTLIATIKDDKISVYETA